MWSRYPSRRRRARARRSTASASSTTQTQCYAIAVPCWKPGFRAGLRPDSSLEHVKICPPPDLRPAGGPVLMFSRLESGRNPARKSDFRPGSTIAQRRVQKLSPAARDIPPSDAQGDRTGGVVGLYGVSWPIKTLYNLIETLSKLWPDGGRGFFIGLPGPAGKGFLLRSGHPGRARVHDPVHSLTGVHRGYPGAPEVVGISGVPWLIKTSLKHF